MQDHLKGVIEILEADTPLTDLVSTRIFGAELPRAEVDSMKRKCVVVKYSGSPGGPGSADYTRLFEFRVDVLSYGETPFEADKVRRAVYVVFKELSRKAQSSTLFHRAVHSGGPIQVRDNDTDWPFVFDSFDVLAAEEAVV